MTDNDSAQAVINKLLGDPDQCCTVGPGKVHWYPQGTKPGGRCYCGELVMRSKL